MQTVDGMSRVVPSSATRMLSGAVAIFLGVLLVVLFAKSAQIAVGNPPSFDGAMNLQVAASIAAGDGYRRNYAAREAFPHEVQTGAPYILPAAVVFKLWGIGITQAEAVNLAYLALLLAIVCWLVAPAGGWPLALFGASTVLLVPGVHQFGLYGYGEIPSLAWTLAALVVYFRGHGDAWRGAAAGLMIAFAVYTKTVMLIGAAALLLCAFLQAIDARRNDDPGKGRRLAALVGGGVAAVVAMETWRALAVGGVRAWRHWWHVETGSIYAQAGVASGFGRLTQSLLGKLQLHFALLSHDYRLSLVLTGLWLALVLAAAVTLVVFGLRRRRADWPALAILLTALVYLGWWLLLTPTAKAWHRRILDGMVCADVGIILVAGLWLQNWRERTPRFSRSVGMLVPVVIALLLPATWLVKGAHTLLAASASEQACEWSMAEAATCAQRNPGASVPALLHVVREVRALPADAYLFAFGWYSAPRVGLFAQRHILDFHDFPVATLEPSRPVYFVQGADTPAESLQRIRKLYDVTRTPDYTYALIHARTLTPAPMVRGSAPVQRHVNAADHYAYMRGFNHSEGSNGRWLTDDNQVLLTPQPGDVFELTIFAVPVDQYEIHRAPNVIVSFDGCRTPAQAAQPGAVSHLVFEIPARCGIAAGQPVNVRIEVDNLVDSGITHDARALGVLAQSFGFVPGGNDGSRPRPGE